MRRTTTVIWMALAIGGLAAQGSRAGDNIEALTSNRTVISHKLWDTSQFPLRWRLNEDGVIDNDVNGNGTADISITDTETAVGQAFEAWEDVPFSDITVTYGGTTTVTDAGCDLTNIVTWSDTTQGWAPGLDVIARGITWSYVGAPLVLNAANRQNVACAEGGAVTLPVASYSNGMTLQPGTILDMDMTWNPASIDYVTTPNATPWVVDVQSVATHEFGHMFGFSHTSLDFPGSDPVTMFPIVNETDVALQNNMRNLEDDDESSSGGYPDTGYWPSGAAPHTTGAISGSVLQPGGQGASGVRVWAYRTTDTSQPVYESFTATQFDWDPALSPGDYRIEGMVPGAYHVCIVPWGVDVPDDVADEPLRYNFTTANGDGNNGFATECFDDAPSGADTPDFVEPDLVRTVNVTAGRTTPGIGFVTGTETTDFMLVMDRSGSMNGPSGSLGITKIEALREAAGALIDYLDLTGGHRLGLVQFAENLIPLAPVFDLQSLTAASAGDAHAAIDAMAAGGLTNIIAGIEEGIGQLTTVPVPNARQIMLVFSDGKHNRPVGSDLADVNDDVVDNDIRFYSVGFGTDVNSAILSQIAADTGGVHVDEQDLDPIALGKHFLSIAASAADETLVIDPRFDVTASRPAELAVPVGPEDDVLTFALLWRTRDAAAIEATLVTPGGCQRRITPGGGLARRRGETHLIARVRLPMRCEKSMARAGTWRVVAKAGTGAAASETVDIVVFGRSPIRLVVEPVMSARGPVLRAKLLRAGRVVYGASVRAEVLIPVPVTGDSEKQDLASTHPRTAPELEPPREKRIVRLALTDDGTRGDGMAKDAVHTAALPLREAGSYRVRVIARANVRDVELQREAVIGVHFDGRRLTQSTIKAPTKILSPY